MWAFPCLFSCVLGVLWAEVVHFFFNSGNFISTIFVQIFLLLLISFLSHLGTVGISLAVQWLRLHASNAGAEGWIPGWGTKIPHAMWRGQKEKKTSISFGDYYNLSWDFLFLSSIYCNFSFFFLNYLLIIY